MRPADCMGAKAVAEARRAAAMTIFCQRKERKEEQDGQHQVEKRQEARPPSDTYHDFGLDTDEDSNYETTAELSK